MELEFCEGHGSGRPSKMRLTLVNRRHLAMRLDARDSRNFHPRLGARPLCPSDRQIPAQGRMHFDFGLDYVATEKRSERLGAFESETAKLELADRQRRRVRLSLTWPDGRRERLEVEFEANRSDNDSQVRMARP